VLAVVSCIECCLVELCVSVDGLLWRFIFLKKIIFDLCFGFLKFVECNLMKLYYDYKGKKN
jgi:hypothetical protein